MSTFVHGLVLTVVGMGLVFLALAIFLGAMVALTRLFPHRETSAEAAPAGPTEAELAAIGAALTIWSKTPTDRVPDPQLGATLAAGPSPWGIASRGAPSPQEIRRSS